MPDESNHLYYARRSYFGPATLRRPENRLARSKPIRSKNNQSGYVPSGFRRDSLRHYHGEDWWSRRVPPPGPYRLFRSAFIVIVSKLTITIIAQISASVQRLKIKTPPARAGGVFIVIAEWLRQNKTR